MWSIKNAQFIKNIANNLRKIIFNNTKNTDMQIITSGHYCTRSTIDKEVKTVVRVYGYDDNQGMYKTDSGYLTESDLINNYVKLDTAMNDRKPVVGIGRKLQFGDLTTINDSDEVWDNIVMSGKSEQLTIPVLKKEVQKNISESELIINSLIKRAFIDSYRKSGNKKLTPLKIEFNIDYDLNTIKNGIDFLNINVDEFCSIFVDKINFTGYLRDAIKQQIINDFDEISEKVNKKPETDNLIRKYLDELNAKYDDKESNKN